MTVFGETRDAWANAIPCLTIGTGGVIMDADAMSVAWTTTMTDVMESVVVAVGMAATATK